MDEGGSDNLEIAMEQARAALYDDDKKVTPEQRRRFNEAGLSTHVKDLLVVSNHPTIVEDDISAEDKVKVYTIHHQMHDKINQGGMDESERNALKDHVDTFAQGLKFADRKFEDIKPEGEEELTKRIVASAEDGDLEEAHKKSLIGTEKDIEPFTFQQEMEANEDLRTPENFQKIKELQEQNGLSKDEFEDWLKASALFPGMNEEEQAAARKELLENYTPVEKNEEDLKSSKEDEQRIGDLIKEVQKSAEDFDEDAFDNTSEGRGLQGRVDSIKQMLTRFNEKYNGKPEFAGKLALKITGGIAVAFILFLLWELSKIHDLAGKGKK